ncbi:MAG: O-antigen ligase family protein [Phormidesmis sp.]
MVRIEMIRLGEGKRKLQFAKGGPPPRREQVWLGSLIALPYVSYASLVVMLGLLIAAMFQRGGRVWRLCGQQGFGWLSGGLLLSASFAMNRGEAFLQLTNFLPFFLFFGILVTVPSVVKQPFIKLEALARWLLLTSVPMNLLAVVEYGLRFETVAPRIRTLALPGWLLGWLLGWLYDGPDFGHRAHSVFSHPNTLSAYLVIILGLGLGLGLKGLAKQSRFNWQQWAEAGAIALCIIAIFCTGSRNGVLIALVLVAIALYSARRHRWVMLSGLVGSGAIAAAVLAWGIGGRSLSLALITQDPRIGVWRLGLDMIWQRPWLGWGFAGLRLTYEPGSIPGYDSIAHAHNVWLFLASEAGIPVMLGFCGVIGRLCYEGVSTFIWGKLPAENRAILLGYLLAFASCLMFALFDVTLFDSRINVLSWGLLASIYLLSHSDPAGPKMAESELPKNEQGASS